MITHFRTLRRPDADEPFFDGPVPESVDELHFGIAVHHRRYPRRPFEVSNPRDRFYLEPVPCQPCTWEEILHACEVLADLHYHEQVRQNREDMKRLELEAALRGLGRFLRWVGAQPWSVA